MKRALRVAIVLATSVTTFVACFSKPTEPLRDDAHRDGGLPDGLHSADAPGTSRDAVDPDGPMCGVPTDDFAGAGPPCGAWGTANGTTLMRNAGMLEVSPSSGSAQCVTSQPFTMPSTGVVLEIPQIAQGGAMPSTTMFGVYQGSGTSLGVEVDIGWTPGSSYVAVYCLGGSSTNAYPPYSSMTHRWWRIKPGVSGSVDIENGSDGSDSHYVHFSTCSAFGSSVTARFGVNAAAAPASPALFDNFNPGACAL